MSAKKQSRRNLLRISFLQLELMLPIARAKAGPAEEGSFRKDCHCCSKKVFQIYVCGTRSLHIYTMCDQKRKVHSFVYAASNLPYTSL